MTEEDKITYPHCQDKIDVSSNQSSDFIFESIEDTRGYGNENTHLILTAVLNSIKV